MEDRNMSAARESGPRSSGAVGLALDPITVEVITEGLNAIMAEMRGNVMRSSYSSVIGLVQDFSCGLFTPEGELIAQGPDHPGHIIPLPWSVRASMEDLGDTLAEGDVILLNDPYRGGTHLNDVTVLWPVFLDGELFCFPAVRAHWADVGGISPGSYTGEATNIFYEGIRIPPIKIYERGELNVAAHRILMSNVRLPEEREGDFRACIGACRVAETRVRELVERYGQQRLVATVEANFDRAERRMRAQIAELPDGEYLAEDYMEFFYEDRFDPGLIALRLEIAGDQMVADFTRSSPQLPGVVNSTAAVAQGGVLIALKSALDSGGRINAGTFRPVECVTTPGTIVSVTYDAPANAHGEVRKRTVGVMLAALSQVAPELVTGDLCGTSFPNVIGGWDSVRSKRFLFLASPSGGNGGFLEADGPDAMTNVDMGNLPLNHPTEEHEPIFPIRIEEVALRPDSEGAGRTRGGAGVVVSVRLVGEEAQYSVTCDRAIIPPWGVVGGESGAPILNYLESATGDERVEFQLGKVSSFEMRQGDLVVMQAAGGGGYGDPLERDLEAVAADVLDGYVSAGRAAAVYGVVLDDSGTPDLSATNAQRDRLRGERLSAAVIPTGAELYTGIRGRHRIQPLARSWAERLGRREGDLIELVSPAAGAPLRAWLRLDESLADDELPLDELGMALLAVSAGERVVVRVPATLNSANDIDRRAGSVLPVAHETRGE
jgi:N-methylhydantoinase B